MAGNFDNWLERCGEWRADLLHKLKSDGGADLVVSYNDVALAFPTNETNPYCPELPLIDEGALFKFGDENGWRVRKAPEVMAEEAKMVPHIRFTRI